MKFLIWLGCALIYGLVNALCNTLDLHPGGFGTLIIAGICIALGVYWCKIYDANHPADDSEEESPSSTDQVPASPAAEDVPACIEPAEQKQRTVVTVRRKVIPPKEKIDEIVPTPASVPAAKNRNPYKLLFWICVAVCMCLAIILIVVAFPFSSKEAPPEPTSSAVLDTAYVFSDCGGGTVSLTVAAPNYTNCYIVLCPSSDKADSAYSMREQLFQKYIAGGIRVYLPAGETTTLNVPASDYELFVATGKVWVSEMELFGDDTYAKKYDSIITFTAATEQSLPIETYGLQSAHFLTISPEDFPFEILPE